VTVLLKSIGTSDMAKDGEKMYEL